MANAISIHEAKNTLTACIYQAEKSGPVTFTRHNKEVAVLVSKTDYDNLQQPSFLKRRAVFMEKFKDELDNLAKANELAETFSSLRQKDVSRSKNGDSIW